MGRSDEGQRNARVAGGGLDQHAFSRLDLPGMFHRLDHGDADTVLHAGNWVEKFELSEQICPGAFQPGKFIEAHDGGIPYGLSDGAEDPAAPRSAMCLPFAGCFQP